MAQQLENNKLRYTIGGIIAGILISIIITIISISINSYSFSIDSVIQMNKENPINLVLLISPIIALAFIGYIAGIPYDRLISRRNYENNINNERFDSIYNFIEKIRKGKTDVKTDVFSDDDKIGLSLINLNAEIERTKEEDESRQKEDIQRHWTSEGLALFGAILREYNDSIEVLANKVISELVKYTDAKQAGFYIIDDKNEGKKIIKEIANFAFDRKRLANKEIEWGEGLIGACIIEKKTTFLDNITDSYIQIESGLGAAKPRSVLIVPIMTEEGVIHGALELASFKIYDEFEIKFTEQIAESIATTISTLKINAETGRLLHESKEHTGTMTHQEDELRKTISDMQRLQENADIQSVAFRAYQDSTNKALIRAEYSNEGKLQFANKKFIDLFGYKSNFEIQNENISKFINPEEANWFETVSENIFNNKHFEGLLRHISKTGKDIWIKSSYIGLLNDNRKVEKILFLGFDVTDLHINLENSNQKISNFNSALLKLELSTSNEILYFNENFIKLTNFDSEEVLNKKITDFIHEDDVQTFTNILSNLSNTGQVFEGEFNIKNSENSKIWLFGSIFPEWDVNNNIVSVNILAYDYSQEHFAGEKIIELESQVEKQNTEIVATRERLSKKVEQTREEMKELYMDVETNNIFFEKTLKVLPNPILTINNDNQIEFLNDKAIELLAISADEEYKGKDINEILPENKKEFKGLYLADIFNYSNESLPLEKEEKVFIIDKNNKQVFFMMAMTEAIIGLRKRLSVILREI